MTKNCSAESDFRNEAPEGFFLTNVPYEGFSKKSFNTEYELLEQLGKGAFSEVRQCRHKPTGKLYAVKISKRDGGQFSFSIAVLRRLLSPIYSSGIHYESYSNGKDLKFCLVIE